MWVNCLCVRIRGGEGGDRMHCMVGNGVLWSRLTVLPFYTSSFVWLVEFFCVFCCFFSLLHVIFHSVWLCLVMNGLCDCVKALSRRHSVGSDSDYKGFMQPTTQHLPHPSVQPAVDKNQNLKRAWLLCAAEWEQWFCKYICSPCNEQ